jgi:hypothetical protein
VTPARPIAFRASVDLDARRARVVAAGTVNGIDFIEAQPDRTTLRVHLLLPGADAFDVGTVRIIREDSADQFPVLTVDAAGTVLTVVTARAGDRASYRLHLIAPDGTEPPAGFDPVLCQLPFSFYPDTAADPRPPRPAGPAAAVPPFADYLARDSASLRTRLADRFAASVPGWNDDSPADPAVMMLELFAALGDRLAYWQDAVGAEAFLGTARRRASVRRHARLLGYDVGEGCAARVWLTFATRRTVTLPAGTPVADRDLPAGSSAADAVAAGAVVFQTCEVTTLTPARTAIEVYAWGDPDHVLAAGSRSAFLVLPAGAPAPDLRRGSVLVLVHLPAAAGPVAAPGGADALELFARARDGDPGLRFAVRLDTDPVSRRDPLAGPVICPEGAPGGVPEGRTVLEIHWAEEDALPRPLPVSTRGPGGVAVACAAALANVMLADEGASLPAEPLLPPTPPADGPFRPRLGSGAPAWVDPVWVVAGPSASTLQTPDPVRAVPALTLDDGRRGWKARRDLLGSGRQDRHVVVEPDGHGGAVLRFGDGIHGRVPDSQVPMAAEYRVGGGARGNVAAGRLRTVLAGPGSIRETDRFGGVGDPVWNPLPAAGGTDQEDTDRARRLAPAGLRRQERAVTSADHAAAAAELGDVHRSAARRRWNGSWYTQVVTVDPVGSEELTTDLALRVRNRLEERRLAGADVAVAAPAYAALSVGLTVHVRDGYARLVVEERVRDAVSVGRGFFHPDRLTFGQAVHLGDLVVAVADVPGVDRVEVTRFARTTDPPPAPGDPLPEVVRIGPLEVARCDSDPDRPDRGQVELTMVGGA